MEANEGSAPEPSSAKDAAKEDPAGAAPLASATATGAAEATSEDKPSTLPSRQDPKTEAMEATGTDDSPKAESAKGGEVAKTAIEVAETVDEPAAGKDDAVAATATTDKVEAKEEDDKPPPPPAKPPTAPLPPPSSSGTLAGLVALIILVSGVVGSILIMRRSETSGAPHKGATTAKPAPKPKEIPWQVGQKVPVSITILPNDDENLDCASTTEIETRHCGYENKDTAWSKSDDKDDQKLLRPYSTTSRKRLIGSGLWSQIKPADRPQVRFTAKCTFEIEGKIEKPLVRFKKGTELREMKDTWMAGQLTHCSVEKK